MNGVEMYLKHEEAKSKFKMIFDEDAENYRFAGADHINMVAEYGKCFGDLKKSIEMVNTHINIQNEFFKAGINVGDEELQEMIMKVIR